MFKAMTKAPMLRLEDIDRPPEKHDEKLPLEAEAWKQAFQKSNLPGALTRVNFKTTRA